LAIEFLPAEVVCRTVLSSQMAMLGLVIVDEAILVNYEQTRIVFANWAFVVVDDGDSVDTIQGKPGIVLVLFLAVVV
jgi:hypothetical protein